MFSNIRARTISISSHLKNRTPTIRFRYGPAREQKASAGYDAASKSSAGGQSQTESIPAGVIYDFQLPQRWRRRPLSEEEIDYINRGGPE